MSEYVQLSLSGPDSLRWRKSLGMGLGVGAGEAVGSGVAAPVGVAVAPAALQAAIKAGRAVSPAAPVSPARMRSRLEIGSLRPRSPIVLSLSLSLSLSCGASVRRSRIQRVGPRRPLRSPRVPAASSPAPVSRRARARAARLPFPNDKLHRSSVGCGAISAPLAPVRCHAIRATTDTCRDPRCGHRRRRGGPRLSAQSGPANRSGGRPDARACGHRRAERPGRGRSRDAP